MVLILTMVLPLARRLHVFLQLINLPVPCEWVDQVPDFFKADMCFKIVCMGYIHNVKATNHALTALQL